MAVSMIRQKLGNKTFTNYVPAGDEDAKSFADALMPGEYTILTKVGESGSETVSDGYRHWVVMIKNENDVKTYLSFVSPLNKNSNDVISALKGKTFDTVKAEVVYVLNERDYTIAGADAGDGEG